MDGSGWVPVQRLIELMSSAPTTEEVEAVVTSSDKQRFVLDKERGLIRAAQGHSIKLENPELTPVLSPEHVPVAVHGTNEDAWVAIQASGCLLPMARTHVHFSTMPVQLKKGHLSAVLLRLDLARAMEAGLDFYLSSNHVLLCAKAVPVQFLKRVTREDLGPEWLS